MVSVQIYGTDKYLDTMDADITYIKTAGDLGELTQINSSYSWTMKFPKTPNNTQILDGLGMVGSGSRKPYEKIYCNLLDNGYPIVVKGLLNIRETNYDYVIYVQEGYIYFIKDVGNDTIGDTLDLSELDHTRDFDTINASLDLSKNYAYLIGDVNGAYLPNESNTTNLDPSYMSPYVNIKYLFDKIFEYYGWTYSVNSDVELGISEKWMSYPSEIILNNTIVQEAANVNANNVSGVRVSSDIGSTWVFKIPMTGTLDNDFMTESGSGDVDFEVQETGNYEVFYDIQAVARKYDIFGFKGIVPYKTRFFVNNTIYADSENNIVSFQIPLNAGDVISLGIFVEGLLGAESIKTTINTANLTVNNITFTGDVSFTQALIKLKISDFIKEVMVRESLTSFVDSENKNIRFLTLDERLSAQVVDWTEKYVSRKKETYLYQDYAQSNLFKHKYDDDLSNYNDGTLFIDNDNLATEKEIYKSFTNSPLNELSTFTDNGSSYEVPHLKMFEVEVRKDEATGDLIGKYKFLKDRFFFVKANLVDKNIYIDTNLVNGFPMVNINGTVFRDIIQDKYKSFIDISNNAKVHEIDLALSLSDIHSLDLSKLYYFQQEASYYILNRLRYKTGQKTTGVFLKVFPEQKLQAFSNAFSNAFNI